MLDRARDKYPLHEMQMRFPFSEQGITEAVDGGARDALRQGDDRALSGACRLGRAGAIRAAADRAIRRHPKGRADR